MAWYNFIRKRDTDTQMTTQTSLEPTTPIVNDVLLKALLNSETITREAALTLPAVSGAVDFISNMIASMPVKLYEYKDKEIEEKKDDPRVALLNSDTGDTLDAFQLKKAMVEDYLLGKGGYCYIEKNRNNVNGLFYVDEKSISCNLNQKPIHKDYKITVLGKEYNKYDFIKLLRNTKNGATGTGLIDEVGKALETAYNTLLYQLNMVKSGGNKKGFIKSTKRLTQEAINTLKMAWQNLYANNQENVVVLNDGLEFQESSNSSVEMQLNESKKTLQDEINNIFHIHPNDFYSTFKEAIYPITRAFATALNRDLLLEKEKGQLFFEFDVKEIIKANVKERYEAYKIAKDTGWLSFNEIRRMENMNYVEGLDAVNVGLGAVLYDFNTHEFYTPNTNTTNNLSETNERYNPNHDLKTGRFSSGAGKGGNTGKNSSLGNSKSSSKTKKVDLYKNVVQGKDLSDSDITDVNEIIKKQGFDGKPILIKDKKEFEKLVKEDTVGMYRGIRGNTKEEVNKYKDMLRHGEFVPNADNLSVSGKGLYTAAYSPKDKSAKNSSRELAEKYAGFRSMFAAPGSKVDYKDTGQVERFTFTKDVKLYKPDEHVKILKDYEVARKGYDGYYNRNGDQVIILNRTKMIILDE